MTSHRALGEQIRDGLAATGLLQRELAAAVAEATDSDCDLNQINKYVNNRELPGKDRMIALIGILDLDVEEAMYAWTYLGPAKENADKVVTITAELRQQLEDSKPSRRGKR